MLHKGVNAHTVTTAKSSGNSSNAMENVAVSRAAPPMAVVILRTKHKVENVDASESNSHNLETDVVRTTVLANSVSQKKKSKKKNSVALGKHLC